MRDGNFVALVRESHEPLLRLADLLEEDPREAEDLVRAALADTRRRRAPDTLEFARERLVRRHVGRRARRSAGSGFVRDGWGVDAAHDDVRRELTDLPARVRAALALCLYEDLPVERAAGVLRTSTDSVRDDVTRGSARLASALATVPASARPSPAPAATEADVRAGLHQLVRDIARPPVDEATVAAEVTSAATARRRSRRWAAAAVAATAAAAVTAGVLLAREAPAPTPEPRDAAIEVPRPPAPVHVYDLPTRGSLADDAAFLAGLLELPWESDVLAEFGGPPVPTPTSRRVLFAGDVPGGRWALLVGRHDVADANGGPWGPDGRMQAWFTGPVGAAPEEMTLSSYPYGIAPEMTPALMDPESGTLVVVAAPGDDIQVSAGSVIEADGSRSREFETVTTTDGVGVTRLDPAGAHVLWSVVYDVSRDGTTVMNGSPEGVLTSMTFEPPRFDIEWPRGRPASPGEAEVARQAAFGVLAALGLSADEAEIVARWSGPVPGVEAGTLAVVTVTVPSGAQVVTVQWWIADDANGSMGGECGLEIRPVTAPVEQRLLAAGCDIYGADGRSGGPVLVALAPPGVASVRLYGSNGTFAGEEPVTDGVLVTPLPQHLGKVEGVTAEGVLLGRTELLGHDNIWE